MLLAALVIAVSIEGLGPDSKKPLQPVHDPMVVLINSLSDGKLVFKVQVDRDIIPDPVEAGFQIRRLWITYEHNLKLKGKVSPAVWFFRQSADAKKKASAPSLWSSTKIMVFALSIPVAKQKPALPERLLMDIDLFRGQPVIFSLSEMLLKLNWPEKNRVAIDKAKEYSSKKLSQLVQGKTTKETNQVVYYLDFKEKPGSLPISATVRQDLWRQYGSGLYRDPANGVIWRAVEIDVPVSYLVARRKAVELGLRLPTLEEYAALSKLMAQHGDDVLLALKLKNFQKPDGRPAKYFWSSQEHEKKPDETLYMCYPLFAPNSAKPMAMSNVRGEAFALFVEAKKP